MQVCLGCARKIEPGEQIRAANKCKACFNEEQTEPEHEVAVSFTEAEFNVIYDAMICVDINHCPLADNIAAKISDLISQDDSWIHSYRPAGS